MSTLGKRSRESLKGVHPDLIRVMQEAIKECPIDFTITSGVRTTAEQQKLYAQGRTKPGPRVTNVDGVVRKSNHQAKSDGFGYAIDLYPYVDGTVQVNNPKVKEWLDTIADHILKVAFCLKVKIDWGGNWKSLVDRPHFELKK